LTSPARRWNLAVCLVAALLLAVAPAFARPPQRSLDQADMPARWALGFTLGDPFGLSLKRYLRGGQAWDLNVAFAYGPGFRVGGDWLWTLARLERSAKFELDLYAGVGPFVGVLNDPCGPGFITNRCNGDIYFGGRVPIGLEVLLREAPVSFGLEIAPGLGFAPGRAGALLDFLLAIRFLFY
jgi:hypothetical protein